MSDLEQRIKGAAEKATPGEWEIRSAVPYGDGQVIFTGRFEKNMTIARWNFHYANTQNDIQYIALASPANILALLAEKDAEIERLTRERDEWKRIAGDLNRAQDFSTSTCYSPEERKARNAYDVLAGKGE